MLKKFDYKKQFGQNFIKDENIINKIVENSNVDNNTLVIEVGPGSGALSEKIIPLSKFSILYEIDTRLKKILENNLKNYDNYKVIFNDFLKEDIKNEISKYNYDKLYVIANLPYYITTPIITKLVNEIIPDKILIMVQKEVADRLCSSVNTKDYGYITSYLNYFYNIKKEFFVSKNCFEPKPNVDSEVISLNKIERLNKVKDVCFLDRFLQDAFCHKRKNLKNNLKKYNLDKINDILLKNNLSLNSRAENISIDIFIEIVNEII